MVLPTIVAEVKVKELSYHEWKYITIDLWIEVTVRNDFDVAPQSYSFMIEIHFHLHKDEIISDEVQNWLLRELLKTLNLWRISLFSIFFLVSKKDGTVRPVINLIHLNKGWLSNLRALCICHRYIF